MLPDFFTGCGKPSGTGELDECHILPGNGAVKQAEHFVIALPVDALVIGDFDPGSVFQNEINGFLQVHPGKVRDQRAFHPDGRGQGPQLKGEYFRGEGQALAVNKAVINKHGGAAAHGL